jgi:hypothetical protein
MIIEVSGKISKLDFQKITSFLNQMWKEREDILNITIKRSKSDFSKEEAIELLKGALIASRSRSDRNGQDDDDWEEIEEEDEDELFDFLELFPQPGYN